MDCTTREKRAHRRCNRALTAGMSAWGGCREGAHLSVVWCAIDVDEAYCVVDPLRPWLPPGRVGNDSGSPRSSEAWESCPRSKLGNRSRRSLGKGRLVDRATQWDIREETTTPTSSLLPSPAPSSPPPFHPLPSCFDSSRPEQPTDPLNSMHCRPSSGSVRRVIQPPPMNASSIPPFQTSQLSNLQPWEHIAGG
jgi:hypothetical protein